ncbi:MAG: sensor histidine kinase [Planctomycetes bacterium]|nr:sensor histidine kinase [Planctomycetota bacterium]
METGEWKLRQERINLLSFLNRIARIYQEDASVLKREFNSRIKIPPDIKIEADSNLLNRALENLFNNALRFTRESDSIYLTAHLKNGEVLISIEDTGPGLTEAEIKLIFEPFYRGTSSRREQGFGLGLSIVKSIINAHGWEIKADSRPGDGTRFTPALISSAT